MVDGGLRRIDLDRFLNDYGTQYAILAFYYLAALAAFLRWVGRPLSRTRRSKLADVLGFVSVLPAIGVTVWLANLSNDTGFPISGWFLVMSIVTLGVLPLVSLACFILVGRLIGRAFS